MRRLVAIVAALALTAGIGVGTAAGGVKAKKLSGEVGPGFKIEVAFAGKDAKTLKAGTYSLHVEDKSGSHNFHLIGPGVNKMTSVPFMGDKTFTVTLKKGKYTYQCDPHAASGMKGSFTVK